MQKRWIIAVALAAMGGSFVAQAQTPTPADRAQTPAAQRSTVDQEFITKALEGGTKEVAMGKLAAQKATNADVKAFANRMVTDHTKSVAELAALTRMSAPSADKMTPPAKLTEANGADFDRAYMAEMVAAHQATVALYEREVREGTDEALKKWANEKLTTVRDHLEKARATQAKVGTTT
jgi:putative membrane protein